MPIGGKGVQNVVALSLELSEWADRGGSCIL